MTVGMQKQIIRTTGVSLSTMLLLALAQAGVQVFLLFDLSQVLVLFSAVFPLIALLCGIFSKVLTGNLWSALIASAAAFSIALLVLFQGSALMYAPLYVGISLIGYGAAYLLARKR
jgi:hypothetical protein